MGSKNQEAVLDPGNKSFSKKKKEAYPKYVIVKRHAMKSKYIKTS